VGAEATPSDISRHSQKIKTQFPQMWTYFSELNTSVPASFAQTESLYSLV